MTTAQFIASIEAKPQFIKWAKSPVVVETIGDIEKHHGIAYVTTPDGTNTFNVWFMVDTVSGEATWQNADTLEPAKNATEVKMNALKAYLKANFFAYFIVSADLENNWAEATVYVDGATLTKSTVLVYKKGATAVTHKAVA